MWLDEPLLLSEIREATRIPQIKPRYVCNVWPYQFPAQVEAQLIAQWLEWIVDGDESRRGKVAMRT